MAANEKPHETPAPATRDHYASGHKRNLDDESSYLHSDHSLIYEMAEALKNSLDPGARVLEVGCGGGHTAGFMTSLGFKVTAVDFSSVAVGTAEKNYPKCDFRVGDAMSLDFGDGSFDAVVSIEMIEHLKDPQSHLSEIKRVLTSSGSYFIKTPNRVLHDIYYRKNENIKQWHPSVMSTKQLADALALAGFSANFVKMRRLPDYQVKKFLDKLGIIGPFAKPVIKALPMGLLPIWLQPSMIVVARKGN